MRPMTARRMLGAAAVIALVATGCGSDDGNGNGSTDSTDDGTDDGDGTAEITLVDPDKLTVCTHLPYEPFQFQDDSGEVVGFDVDLLDLLADDLGVEQEILNMGDWNQVVSGAAFAAGRCDIGMGAMTITDERAEALTISRPYFEATQVLAVPAGSGIAGMEDLDGLNVGVQTDTTGQTYAEERADEFGYTTQNFEDVAIQLNALAAGNIDVAINDNLPVEKFIESNSNVEIAVELDTQEQYGFPAKKDDPSAEALIARLDELLDQAIEDGTYAEIHVEWFDIEPAEINW